MIPVLLAPAQAQAWLPHADGTAASAAVLNATLLADDPAVSRWLAEWEPVVLAQVSSPEELPALMARETAVHDATLMLSLAVDADVSDATRLEIAADLDEMLAEAEFARDFSALWHSRPLAPQVSEALNSLQSACVSLPRLQTWLVLILQRQPLISNLCLAWDLIPSAVFQSNSREMTRDHCRLHGFFLSAAEAVENETVETFLAECLMKSGLPVSANARILFTSWFASFRTPHSRYSLKVDETDWDEFNDDVASEQSQVQAGLSVFGAPLDWMGKR